MTRTIAMILAPETYSRGGTGEPMALRRICGRESAFHVSDACRAAGVREFLRAADGGMEMRRMEGDLNDCALITRRPWALEDCRAAVDLLGETEADLLVVPGDIPLVTGDVLAELLESHRSTGAEATVLTSALPVAGPAARVTSGGDGRVQRISDARDSPPAEGGAASADVYCFRLSSLRKALTPAAFDSCGGFDLSGLLDRLMEGGARVCALNSTDSNVVDAVTDLSALARVTGVMQRRILNELMRAGVTVVDPCATYVDYDVRIGRGSVIHPCSFLESGSRIGDGCVIGPGVRLSGVELGNEVTVAFSTVAESIIGDGTRIGPFANIRPGCSIGRKVKIGDFVEAKNAELGDGVSMGHLSYVGDASIGERTNIGAGVITCNYDGFTKHRTTVGRNVFLGSGVTLIAPVSVGDGALIAAGSTITEDVPEDALGIARTRQTVKELWARRRREQKQ